MSNASDPAPLSNIGDSRASQSPGETSAGLGPVAAQPIPPTSSWRLAAQMLLATAVSVALGGILVQQFGRPFRMPLELSSGMRQVATPEHMVPVNAAERR